MECRIKISVLDWVSRPQGGSENPGGNNPGRFEGEGFTSIPAKGWGF